MPEETEKEVVEETAEEKDDVQSQSPETKKTDKKTEHMIPKSRLDEVIAKRDAAEKELKKLQEAEAERKKSELTELDRLKLEKQEADSKAEKAVSEAKELKMQMAFEDAAEELDIAFVSKQAAKDAFFFLDKEKAGEDGKNMKKALEVLQTERPHLFEKSDDEPATDARQKGTRPAKEVLEKEKEAELKSRYCIRKPR